MASFREYANRFSNAQLQALLREECAGRGALATESILDICDILSQRNPEMPTVRDLILSLCRCYLEQK